MMHSSKGVYDTSPSVGFEPFVDMRKRKGYLFFKGPLNSVRSFNFAHKATIGLEKMYKFIPDNTKHKEGKSCVKAELFNGRFRSLGSFSSGSFSSIFKVEDEYMNNNQLAVKILNSGLHQLGSQEAVWLRALNFADPLDVSHVVRLHSSFIHKGRFCLALELLGPSLMDLLIRPSFITTNNDSTFVSGSISERSRNSNNGSGVHGIFLPSNECVDIEVNAKKHKKEALKCKTNGVSVYIIQRIAVQLLAATAFVHSQGLIHADLKPENILVVLPKFEVTRLDTILGTDDKANMVPHLSSPNIRIKLVDFGNAIPLLETGTYLSDGQTVQSLLYRAPEVALGLGLGTAVDIWSIGCILAEFYMGEPLFDVPEDAHQDDSEEGTLLKLIQELLGPLPSSPQYTSSSPSLHIKKEVNDVHYHMKAHITLAHRMHSKDHQFIGFLLALLTLDPDKRPTAPQALTHPFLASTFPFVHVFGTSSSSSSSSTSITTIDPIVHIPSTTYRPIINSQTSFDWIAAQCTPAYHIINSDNRRMKRKTGNYYKDCTESNTHMITKVHTSTMEGDTYNKPTIIPTITPPTNYTIPISGDKKISTLNYLKVAPDVESLPKSKVKTISSTTTKRDAITVHVNNKMPPGASITKRTRLRLPSPPI